MIGLPRPVSSPVSDRPSEYAIEMPAPIDGGEAGDERGVRLVRVERDSEDGRKRRQRPVDQADHGRLDALEEEGVLGHRVECTKRFANDIEHKELLTSEGRAA